MATTRRPSRPGSPAARRSRSCSGRQVRGDAIRTALQASQTVTVNGTSAGDFRSSIPPTTTRSTPAPPAASATRATSSPTSRASGRASSRPRWAPATRASRSAARRWRRRWSPASPRSSTPSTPDWTAEEVKADIMNTADQDLFTRREPHRRRRTRRTGSEPAASTPRRRSTTRCSPTSPNDPGAVSVSFGTVAAASPTTLTKTIDVENKGGSAATYASSYDAITQLAGATYSVSPSSVTVGRGRDEDGHVTLTVTPSHAHEDDRSDGGPDAGRARTGLRRRRERPDPVHERPAADLASAGLLRAAAGVDDDATLDAPDAERQECRRRSCR